MGILIENLSFHYTGTPVLDQVNLEVKDGDYAILTGENGSGKSTLLKCWERWFSFLWDAVQLLAFRVPQQIPNLHQPLSVQP